MAMRSFTPLFLLVIGAQSLSAQSTASRSSDDNERRPMTVSIGMRLGIPQGEFDLAYDRELFGLGGNFSVPFRRLPFEWGLDIGWQRMGSTETTVAINEEFIDATEADLDMNADMWAYHTFVRFKPLRGRVCPYADAFVGVRTFSARTKIRVDGLEEPLSNERNAMDAAFSYGWGAGLMVKLNNTINVEAGFQKLEGTKVSYVDPNSISISPEGVVGFSTLTSSSDLINIHVGIGFNF